MQINLSGTLFESLKTGKLVFVHITELDNVIRYRSEWVECREIGNGTLSDLRTWEVSDLVEAVAPIKINLSVAYDSNLIRQERGALFGLCATYSCQRPLAGWYNNRTGKYVCARCALAGNSTPRAHLFESMHGHKKYTPGGPGRPN